MNGDVVSFEMCASATYCVCVNNKEFPCMAIIIGTFVYVLFRDPPNYPFNKCTDLRLRFVCSIYSHHCLEYLDFNCLLIKVKVQQFRWMSVVGNYVLYLMISTKGISKILGWNAFFLFFQECNPFVWKTADKYPHLPHVKIC